MGKIHELAFPLHEINRLAMSERSTKGHPGNIQLWWNRSPINSSAVLLKALLKSTTTGICTDKTNVTVVDPFCGSGCLTLAAMSSGLQVYASDLNSVAVVITKAVSEYPGRFIDSQPVSSAAEIRLYAGLAGLAEDVQCYGSWISEEVRARLDKYYPDTISLDKQSYAWIWTRTAQCPNPACKCQMPLASSYILSKQKNKEYYANPIVYGDHVGFQVLRGAPEQFLNGNKVGKQGAKFRCPKCGTITKDEYIKHVGQTGKLGIELMAVCYTTEEGRIFISPDAMQVSAAHPDIIIDIPIGKIPENTRWFSPPLFGLTTYAELYTLRQILLMTTLCDLINEVQEKCKKDALEAGLPDDNIPLEEGGSGALAYSQAIAFYLSLVVGKLSNYQSSICTWDNRKGNIRAAFTRQAIPMTWTFAEGNPFSSVTGNINTMLSDVVSTVKNLPINMSSHVTKNDALHYSFPQNSLLFTELPYYDNVGYADLSDYFYVWLRLCMKNILPGLFDQVASSKDELSSIPEHFGGDTQLAIKSYENGIRKFFVNFRKTAAKAYSSILFFEFGKQDEIVMSTLTGQALSHWENLIDALMQADFRITAVLPVRTEKPNERFGTSRVAVVFKPKEDDAPQILRRTAVAELKHQLPAQLEESFVTEMDEWDRPIVGMGCGLALFTRYARVLNADGSSMCIHDALHVIWTEVTEYIRTIVSEME